MDIVIAYLQTLVAADLAHAGAAALVVGPIVVWIVNKLKAQFPMDGKSLFNVPLALIVSIVASFIVPTGAYTALQLLSSQPFTTDGFVVAASVGFMVAQTFYHGTKQKD